MLESSAHSVSPAPMVDGEPVDNSVTVERNLYKHLYEDLLNKVMAR